MELNGCLWQGEGGVICLLPKCPGGVVSKRLQGALQYPGGDGFFSISRGGGGRARGGRVKRKHGFDFPDKAAASSPLPPPGPRGCLPVISRLSALAGLPAAPAGRGLPPPTCCAPRDGACGRQGGREPRLLLQLPPWRLRGAPPPRPVSS